MRLVINIDEDILQGIIEGKGDEPRDIVRSFQATIADAIKNGTPLPKGKMLPQELKEPIWEKNSIPCPYCPECNEKILTLKTKYCYNCGQAIDMSGFLNYLLKETRMEVFNENSD